MARDETARIVCDLEANPNSVHFTWVFNNSVDTVDIPQNQISYDKTRSTLSYTPVNELDYGTLLCWGKNEIGAQKQPCVYHLSPAGELLVDCYLDCDGNFKVNPIHCQIARF